MRVLRKIINLGPLDNWKTILAAGLGIAALHINNETSTAQILSTVLATLAATKKVDEKVQKRKMKKLMENK